jgi:hypothetical protein
MYSAAGCCATYGCRPSFIDSSQVDSVVYRQRRLIQRVEQAQTLRPRIQTVGDAFAKRVVPSSFAAALLASQAFSESKQTISPDEHVNDISRVAKLPRDFLLTADALWQAG